MKLLFHAEGLITNDTADNFTMKAEVVIEIITLLKVNNIDVVVDGGWGVDALLGVQSRPHNDLDIAIPHKDVTKLKTLLSALGYSEVINNDTRECNFVLEDKMKNQIDVHSYTFDGNGNNVFGVAYLPEHFTGNGIINGYFVKCISPEWMIKFHTGYEIDQNDFFDMLALSKKFKISLPSEYDKFISKEN